MSGSQVKCPQCGAVLTVPSQSLGPGVTIGGFEIVRMLGEGGMGEVYLARQLSLGRNVALKILPAEMKARRGIVQRFFKEVRLLARLEHPNIVMAHEAGEDAGVMYLAMGYVDGESLAQKLIRDGPMDEGAALQMAVKLAGALDYAWREHQLLHRDIKPSNVMLAKSGEVKLMDFGLAKCLADKGDLTISGAVIGTPNYMSPEQVEGNADLDCRADMYSLGATLYHMVTGKLPFAGSSILETLRKQVSEALPDPRTANPAVTENCVTLLEIMLSKKRERRHADYQALIGDMERVRAGRPPSQERLKEGESVMLRAEALGLSKAFRTAAPSAVAGGQSTKSNRKIVIAAAAGALMLAGIAAALALGLFSGPSAEKPKAEGAQGVVSAETAQAASATATSAESPQPEDSRTKLNKQYMEAMAFSRAHPDDFAGAMVLLEPLAKAAAGTELEGRVNDEIGRVGRVRRQAVDRAITAMKEEAAALVARGDFDGALKRIELDTGPVTEETKAAREELAREVKDKKRAADEAMARQAAETAQKKQAAAAKEKLVGLAQGLAEDLLKGDSTAMAARVQAARSDPALGAAAGEVGALYDLALQAIDWPDRVAKSFLNGKGKDVAVEFKGGRKESLTVTGIEGERIKAQRQMAAGFIGRNFTVHDLSATEKIKRLGDGAGAETKIMRGLVFAKCANDWPAAEKEFSSTGEILGEALAKMAPGKPKAPPPSEKPAEEKAAAETGAEKAAVTQPEKPDDFGRPLQDRPMMREMHAHHAMRAILKTAEVFGDPRNPQALADEIRKKKYTPEAAARIHAALADFEKKFSDTMVARHFADVLRALWALEPARGAPAGPDAGPAKLKPATD